MKMHLIFIPKLSEDNKLNKCEGVVIPMVTPFDESGNIDCKATRRITRYIVTNGCMPFIMGTTGESTSIAVKKRKKFVDAVVSTSNGEAPVYVGISSNCLEESVDMAAEFKSLGAAFAVAHLPFYYPLKPYQILKYYERLADSINLPLLLYNIRATTNMSIPLKVVFELSEHPSIMGIKDSEKDIERQVKTAKFCKTKDKFYHLVGWASKSTHMLSAGSDGIVPSLGNIIPALYKKLYDAVKLGNIDIAKKMQETTNKISRINQSGKSLSESLTALKVMMHEFGLCKKNVLPPLLPFNPEEENKITSTMNKMNLKDNVNLNEIQI